MASWRAASIGPRAAERKAEIGSPDLVGQFLWFRFRSDEGEEAVSVWSDVADMFQKRALPGTPHPYITAHPAEAASSASADSPALGCWGAALLFISSVLTANGTWELNTCARASVHVALGGIIPMNVSE